MARHQDLCQATKHLHFASDSHQYYDPNANKLDGHTVQLACDQETREMHRMMEMLQDGGVGYMPEKKREDGYGYCLRIGTV